MLETFKIRNIAAEGFDRAIVAMRREHGGREMSDSEWHADADDGCCLFEIGPGDKAECLRLIKLGDCDFMKFIGLWAHIEADARWWAIYCGYFPAASVVERHGDRVTKSVMTTYANMRNLMDAMHEIAAEGGGYWKMWAALCEALEVLPESWMILPKTEKEEA